MSRFPGAWATNWNHRRSVLLDLKAVAIRRRTLGPGSPFASAPSGYRIDLEAVRLIEGRDLQLPPERPSFHGGWAMECTRTFFWRVTSNNLRHPWARMGN